MNVNSNEDITFSGSFFPRNLFEKRALQDPFHVKVEVFGGDPGWWPNKHVQTLRLMCDMSSAHAHDRRTVTSDNGPFPIFGGYLPLCGIAGTSRFEPCGQRLEPNEATHTHVRTELTFTLLLATLGDEWTY